MSAHPSLSSVDAVVAALAEHDYLADRGLATTIYLAASLKALDGDAEQALELLARAIELEPRNRVHAYHDPDFRELRDADGFSSLLRSGSAAPAPAAPEPAVPAAI